MLKPSPLPTKTALLGIVGTIPKQRLFQTIASKTTSLCTSTQQKASVIKKLLLNYWWFKCTNHYQQYAPNVYDKINCRHEIRFRGTHLISHLIRVTWTVCIFYSWTLRWKTELNLRPCCKLKWKMTLWVNQLPCQWSLQLLEPDLTTGSHTLHLQCVCFSVPMLMF